MASEEYSPSDCNTPSGWNTPSDSTPSGQQNQQNNNGNNNQSSSSSSGGYWSSYSYSPDKKIYKDQTRTSSTISCEKNDSVLANIGRGALHIAQAPLDPFYIAEGIIIKAVSLLPFEDTTKRKIDKLGDTAFSCPEIYHNKISDLGKIDYEIKTNETYDKEVTTYSSGRTETREFNNRTEISKKEIDRHILKHK